ncbi:OLC1v1032325C1 [Oldenlandia corymbosa var. corymbosa]|uniref:OLC1v1032325C1 n=1 Tax=Oldenlandia corymbosa var. corymbosa TaxID=529605 RepID=A0AAV1CNE9_OLDCO|nr:OLC1v1032325C1 [Oldenlandia corymbosa var. corymbosa]
MRINLDCNACCRKMRRIILRMKEIETHAIEKQHLRVIVCGRFVPADVAIKIRKKMKRRVEILEIQEFTNAGPNEHVVEQGSHFPVPDHHHDHGMPMPPPYFQFPEHHHRYAIPQYA